MPARSSQHSGLSLGSLALHNVEENSNRREQPVRGRELHCVGGSGEHGKRISPTQPAGILLLPVLTQAPSVNK